MPHPPETQTDAIKALARSRYQAALAIALGRYDAALTQFRLALVIRERGTNAQATRTAHWMIAWTLRALKRTDEALAIQLRLECEADLAKQPDPYIFEELAILYRERGDGAWAAHYSSRRDAMPK